MHPTQNTRRFVFPTRGVCPPEIHFKLVDGTLQEVRFVGGGCPGNALLVSRLLNGRPVDEVKAILKGIACRNDTSCPDQLALAIQAVESGTLQPAESFRTLNDPNPHRRLGLIGDLDGDDNLLPALLQSIGAHRPDIVYCIGNLTGDSPTQEQVLQRIRKAGLVSVQGDRDWQYATGNEPGGCPPLDLKERDWLLQRPQVLNFRLGNRNGLAFYGEYIQNLPGFSDFEPFALEINMVCGLASFMADTAVFPALEAMLPQFAADLVLFGQARRWGHWQLGEKDFVSIGAARENGGVSWGLLTSDGKSTTLEIIPCEDQ